MVRTPLVLFMMILLFPAVQYIRISRKCNPEQLDDITVVLYLKKYAFRDIVLDMKRLNTKLQLNETYWKKKI